MAEFEIDPDISVAKTIPSSFYTNLNYFEKAREKIFAPSWQYVADAGVVAKPGSCYPFSLLKQYIGEPLLLTMDNDYKIRCLSNVCTHRGNIIVDQPCETTNLRCRYHGRLFTLDGKFKSMPEFKEVKNFPTDEDNLTGLPVFRWGNLLFTSILHHEPAEAFFGEMINRVGWLPLDQFVPRPELSKSYVVHANWALYCENYLEGFHIPFVHAGLNAVIDYGNYTTEVFRYSNLQLGIAKDDELTFDLPESSPDYGKKVAAYYFWVFPNMMFNFYPWGLSVNIVKPVSKEETVVDFLTFVWKEELFNTGAGSDLNQVEMEDEEIVEAVQTGVRSRFYNYGRYSVNREQGTHHFHRLIAAFMG
jgi:choline monooxygenase